MNENEETVTCPICNKQYKTLVSHVVHTHKMNIQQFRILYPEAKVFSKNRMDRFYQCAKELGFGKFNKNKKLTDKHRKKISEAGTGCKNAFYGKKHTEVTRKQMVENHADFTGDKNPLVKWLNESDDNRKQYSKNLKDAWTDKKKDTVYWEKLCKNRSDIVSELMLTGKLEPYGKNHKHGYFKSERQNIEIYYRSSYEEKFLNFCEESFGSLIVKYNAANIRIPYVDDKNSSRYYIPDFIVNNNILIEIKPKSLLYYSNNNLKIEALKQYCLNNNLKSLVITEKELKNLQQVFENIL